VCTLSEKEKIEALEKKLYKVYLIKDNIVVSSYFGNFVLLVLNSNFEIINKFWGEKEKIIKCFNYLIKKNKLNPAILNRKRKINFKPFKMDLDCRNSWFDF
jgi:long-subunit acyl-CoA synthetase (AMP-forming)